MIAAPVPDMQGGREQSVWFRFQLVQCQPGYAPPCTVAFRPLYFDTYWFSNTPINAPWIPKQYRASATGFFENLIAQRSYWDAQLAAEGMMELRLPSTEPTNGTWLQMQAPPPAHFGTQRIRMTRT